MLEDDLFANVKLNKESLMSYGFKEKDGALILERTFHEGEFKAEITISSFLDKVSGTIYDLSFGDVYTNFRSGKETPFSLSIKEEYSFLLNDIIDHCGTRGLYKSLQADRMDSYMMGQYNPLREFPFSDYPSYGTYKNEKGKWFGIVMDIPYAKLDKSLEGMVTILNLKITFTEEFLKVKGIYPAYHMNKKSWISVVLDETLPDGEIKNLIDESYHNVMMKKS